MRFHFGVSFRLKHLKKLLFPILIGILSYFGFSLISFIPTFALENYDTKYIIDYSNVSNYVSMDIDNSHHTLVDLVNSINSNSNISREYTIVVSTYQNNIKRIDLYAFDSSLTYSFSVWGGTTILNSYLLPSSVLQGKLGSYIDMTSLSDNIFNTTFYSDSITCLTGGSCGTNSINSIRALFFSNYSISNTTNSNVSYENNFDLYFYFYSSKDLILTNDYRNNESNTYYKTLSIDNVDYGIGDKFPTYYDLYLQPTPDEPDEPTENSSIFNKIYWFTDNDTDIGVLSNIYILLFIYCFSVLIIKFLTILKHTRWKK